MATQQGIKIINCPTHNSYAVAEHAIGLIFAVARKIVSAHRSIENAEWTPAKFIGYEIAGKKLLTIGYGNIGKNIHRIAKGIGMTTVFANSSAIM